MRITRLLIFKNPFHLQGFTVNLHMNKLSVGGGRQEEPGDGLEDVEDAELLRKAKLTVSINVSSVYRRSEEQKITFQSYRESSSIISSPRVTKSAKSIPTGSSSSSMARSSMVIPESPP
jgi:hypothetical protein